MLHHAAVQLIRVPLLERATTHVGTQKGQSISAAPVLPAADAAATMQGSEAATGTAEAAEQLLGRGTTCKSSWSPANTRAGPFQRWV